MKEHYLNEHEPSYTPLLVIQEASRCLLCHDAPCSQCCPAGTMPDKFIRSVYFRNFKGAAETIRENNALGGICARVCPTEKLCQKGCTRSGIDSPIDIGRIQQFITDFEDKVQMKILKPGSKHLGKVAIIGSGPAGLQASVTLSDLGYDVTVYEKDNELGGWLRKGIPQYRLSSDLVDKEVNRIREIGVTFVTGVEVGKDVSLDTLKAENKAVLLAVGASYGSLLPMFEQNKHVEIAVDLLEQAKANQGNIPVPKSVVIIGGGDVAMDIATTLKLLGCESVTCVAREELHEFPASKKEFNHALSTNVSIIDGFTPISVKDNQVIFKHVRRNDELKITAEKIILAVGQFANLKPFNTVKNHNGIVEVKEYQTSDKKVFAAGDIVFGDKSVVNAVRLGKEAANAIHQYLQGADLC